MQHADAGLGEQEAEFMNNRRVNAPIWLDTPTGELIAAPGCGALMGDSRAPVDFRKAYRPCLAKWQEKLEQAWGSEDTKATLAICMGGDEQADPSDMQKVDIGRTVFADDLARTQVVRSLAAALEFIEKADQILGECLGEQGHSQNSSKKVIMPHFKKRSDRWHFASLTGGMAGNVSVNARYLGSTLSIFQFNRPEREKRVQAVRAARASLGKFWTSDAPEKQKRFLFMGQVMGSAVSSLVAFVLRPEDCRPLDKLLCKFLKVLLKGRATWIGEEGLRTLSHDKLRFYWGIPKVATARFVCTESSVCSPRWPTPSTTGKSWQPFGQAGGEGRGPAGLARHHCRQGEPLGSAVGKRFGGVCATGWLVRAAS